jgi:hypothetical protein
MGDKHLTEILSFRTNMATYLPLPNFLDNLLIIEIRANFFKYPKSVTCNTGDFQKHCMPRLEMASEFVDARCLH